MIRGGGGGGVVMLYCLLCPAGAGADGGRGYFQVDLVISVRVFRPGCGQITRVGGNHHCPVGVTNTHLPPHTVNLTRHQSSNQHQRSGRRITAFGQFGKNNFRNPFMP